MKAIQMLIIIVLLGCEAGAPTGYETVPEKVLVVTCGVRPGSTHHLISVTKLYTLSNVSSKNSNHDNIIIPDAQINFYHNKDSCVVSDSAQIDIYSDDYGFYSIFTEPIAPNDTLLLSVSHAEYDSVLSEIIIPDSVTGITKIDTFNPQASNMEFDWYAGLNTIGFDSRLVLHVKADSFNYSFDFSDTFNRDEVSGVNYPPRKWTGMTYKTKAVIDQIEYFFSEEFFGPPISELDQVYLQLEIFSLDEAYYYSTLWKDKPDEYSGFSAPLKHYSNIDNGVGLFGAYWVTLGKPISISLSWLESIME